PYVQSTSGRRNRSRMQCTINTSEGIIDPVPGAPTVEISVTRVTSYDINNNPNGFETAIAKKDPEVDSVFRQSQLVMRFADIMNVATLLNPSSGLAPFILVEVDYDGSLSTSDPLDRVKWDGVFKFAVDQERLETFLTFTPNLPFPSAGPTAPASPRRIAVTIPTGVQDLVSNPVLPANGGGTTGMVPELSLFGETNLPGGDGEDFDNTTFEDTTRSGASWGGGRLAPGITGGSGRLGDLILKGGTQVVLNTDMQDFPLVAADGVPIDHVADILVNPTGSGDNLADWGMSWSVIDGKFPFNVVEVEPGANLRIEGSQPGLLWSRGEATVHTGGSIDLVGVTPEAIDSMDVLNPDSEIPVAVSAANGAQGGYGGDRFDMSVNSDMLNLPDADNDARTNVGADLDGRAGQGVGGGIDGDGPGGLHFPTNYPTLNTETDPLLNNNHGVTFNITTNLFGTADSQCRSLTVGQAGGGGAYATDGGAGVAASFEPLADFPFGDPNTPLNTPGGDSLEVGLMPPDENNLGYTFRTLDWTQGFLRGGSGGGGGANHPFGSWATGYDGNNTEDCINDFALSSFRAWHDHSGAQGGYGGGAMHFVSGRKLVINGIIDARGGNGGSPRGSQPPDPPFTHDWGQYAMPGGGGSGGALRLVAPLVEIADVGGRIDLRGGSGGAGFAAGALGGAGGTGLLRIEDQAGLVDRSTIADDVAPFEPSDDSLGWISVAPAGLSSRPTSRPDSISASSSCWLAAEGTYTQLTFVDDAADPNTGDPADMGWNMTVIWDDGSGEELIPFRGANSEFPNSFETTFGNLLGYDVLNPTDASPIVVRFQGARYTGNPANLCDLDLNDPANGLVAGSVTPWVDHPELLNDFLPAPNVIRFCVVFDGTIDGADVPGNDLAFVKGIDDFWLRAVPD
ncbi:MAG: hypothetical protein O2816_19545, partial [Planctomycetota bacterium]|nr:hypothetical protein [Planctomycetota bacterium]